MSQLQLRINGRGNAWPVIIGQDHPFYDRKNFEDMANASCSILKSNVINPEAKDIEWELMIDAGHGAAQYLLKYCNRIPDALFITHPHIDHTLGMDWIIQSYFKQNQKPYPVYATLLCWDKIKETFPQLERMVDYKELLPFTLMEVSEAVGLSVKAFPVYHGKSADGASMLYFVNRKDSVGGRILITGDILCPLLRVEDYDEIKSVDVLVVDSNNRYPYPNSNHWSIVNGVNLKDSEILLEYIKNSTVSNFLYPHIRLGNTEYNKCFEYFIRNKTDVSEFHFTIKSFIERVLPHQIVLLHYSGSEDEKYYKEDRLSENYLLKWLNNIALDLSCEADFIIPYVSQHIKIVNT